VNPGDIYQSVNGGVTFRLCFLSWLAFCLEMTESVTQLHNY